MAFTSDFERDCDDVDDDDDNDVVKELANTDEDAADSLGCFLEGGIEIHSDEDGVSFDFSFFDVEVGAPAFKD